MCELLSRRSFESKAEARTALFTCIEGWYNPRRRHSALGYRSPAQFERLHHDNARTPPSSVEHGLTTVGARVAGAAPPVDNPADAHPSSNFGLKLEPVTVRGSEASPVFTFEGGYAVEAPVTNAVNLLKDFARAAG